jgi:hypothetical protein
MARVRAAIARRRLTLPAIRVDARRFAPGSPTRGLCALGWATPTNLRQRADVSICRRRRLTPFSGCAAALGVGGDARWASCLSLRYGLAPRRGRRERPAALAQACGHHRAVERHTARGYRACRRGRPLLRPITGGSALRFLDCLLDSQSIYWIHNRSCDDGVRAIAGMVGGLQLAYEHRGTGSSSPEARPQAARSPG